MQLAMRGPWDSRGAERTHLSRDADCRSKGWHQHSMRSLHAMERMVLISLPLGRGQLRDEKFVRLDGVDDGSCRCGFDRQFESAAGSAAYAGTERSASTDGERASVSGHHRTQSDGADAGWRAAGDGYLPA